MEVTYSRARKDLDAVWVENGDYGSFEQSVAIRHQYRCDDCRTSILREDLFINASPREPPSQAPDEASIGFYIDVASCLCDQCRQGANGVAVDLPERDTWALAVVDAHKGWKITLPNPDGSRRSPYQNINESQSGSELQIVRESAPSLLYEGSGRGPDSGISGKIKRFTRSIKRRISWGRSYSVFEGNPMKERGPNPGDPRVPHGRDYGLDDAPDPGEHINGDPQEMFENDDVDDKEPASSITGPQFDGDVDPLEKVDGTGPFDRAIGLEDADDIIIDARGDEITVENIDSGRNNCPSQGDVDQLTASGPLARLSEFTGQADTPFGETFFGRILSGFSSLPALVLLGVGLLFTGGSAAVGIDVNPLIAAVGDIVWRPLGGVGILLLVGVGGLAYTAHLVSRDRGGSWPTLPTYREVSMSRELTSLRRYSLIVLGGAIGISGMVVATGSAPVLFALPVAITIAVLACQFRHAHIAVCINKDSSTAPTLWSAAMRLGGAGCAIAILFSSDPVVGATMAYLPSVIALAFVAYVNRL